VKRLGTGKEITCLAWDTSDRVDFKLATGTRDSLIQVWTLNSNAQLQSIFAVQLGKTVPSSLAFADNDDQDVLVFGLFDGVV
jgi:WD40 repeat protein